MEDIAEFWENIRGIVKGINNTIIPGTVASVNETDRTCTINTGSVRYEDVRLYSVVKANLQGFCFIPRIGSTVLAARIDGSNELLVVMFSEIDKVLFTVADVALQVDKDACLAKAGNSTVRITPAGITITRSGAGLKKTLDDLLTAIQKLTVPTAVGPSSTPVNIADFIKIQQDLNNYLEE